MKLSFESITNVINNDDGIRKIKDFYFKDYFCYILDIRIDLGQINVDTVAGYSDDLEIVIIK